MLLREQQKEKGYLFYFFNEDCVLLSLVLSRYSPSPCFPTSVAYFRVHARLAFIFTRPEWGTTSFKQFTILIKFIYINQLKLILCPWLPMIGGENKSESKKKSELHEISVYYDWSQVTVGTGVDTLGSLTCLDNW